MTSPLKNPRPLSPHLQVYNLFKITSLTSILHRLTGVALIGAMLIPVWWIMAMAHGQESYECFLKCVTSPFGQLILVGFTWAFWYHSLNGIRHLAWDTGVGFSKKVYPITGALVIGGSFALTIVTWLYIWSL